MFADSDFGWSDDSRDNDSDSNSSKPMNGENVQAYDSGGESGNDFKEELKKQLFKDEEPSTYEDIPKKTKKRKIKDEPGEDESCPKSKRVKIEQDSDTEHKKKKKKSKHKQTEENSLDLNGDIEENDYTNTELQTIKAERALKRELQTSINGDSNFESPKRKRTKIRKSSESDNSVSSVNNTNTNHKVEDESTDEMESSKHVITNQVNESIQRDVPDTNDRYSEQEYNENSIVSLSKPLRQYLRKVSDSRPLETLKTNERDISEAEDLWLIRCPVDLDVSKLVGVALDPTSTCKFKSNGRAYEGECCDGNGAVAVLVQRENTFGLHAMPLAGTLQLRRRLPKRTNKAYDIKAESEEEADGVPLPPTRRRHPLFGPDYKRAVKISSAVSERLSAPVSSSTVRKKRKDKKESKLSKEHRKIKREPDWDSEQAIQDNLFNC